MPDVPAEPTPPRRRPWSRGPRPSRGTRAPAVEETSAGGLVVDREHNRAVLIARRDRQGRLRWLLPKGHIESGESAEQAALREVEEETGIVGRVIAPLGVIDYWFTAPDRRVHKTVHHYLMEAAGGDLSDDDIEVETVAWVPLGALPARLAYPDERRLAGLVPVLLADRA